MCILSPSQLYSIPSTNDSVRFKGSETNIPLFAARDSHSYLAPSKLTAEFADFERLPPPLKPLGPHTPRWVAGDPHVLAYPGERVLTVAAGPVSSTEFPTSPAVNPKSLLGEIHFGLQGGAKNVNTALMDLVR